MSETAVEKKHILLHICIHIHIYQKTSSFSSLSTVSTLAQISLLIRLSVGRSSQSHGCHDPLQRWLLFLYVFVVVILVVDVLELLFFLVLFLFVLFVSCCLYLAVHDGMTWYWWWPLLSSYCGWSKIKREPSLTISTSPNKG